MVSLLTVWQQFWVSFSLIWTIVIERSFGLIGYEILTTSNYRVVKVVTPVMTCPPIWLIYVTVINKTQRCHVVWAWVIGIRDVSGGIQNGEFSVTLAGNRRKLKHPLTFLESNSMQRCEKIGLTASTDIMALSKLAEGACLCVDEIK